MCAQQEVAGAQEHRTQDDREPVAPFPLGEDAAKKRREVHAAQIGAVNLVRVFLQEGLAVVRIGHVELEDRQHAVKAEALPQLGKEENGQADRMAGAHKETRNLRRERVSNWCSGIRQNSGSW